MSHNDEEYDDSIMLSESLERIAAQAMHLKEKIEAGLQLPSWAEYKVYQAYDSVNKALGAAYPGRYEMGNKKASVFDLVKEANLAGMTYDPANTNIRALQSQHGANWKKVLAAQWGISEDAITPITRSGMGAQNKVAFADPNSPRPMGVHSILKRPTVFDSPLYKRLTRGTKKEQGPKKVPGAMY